MANLNLSQFGEKLFVADADHTFIWDTAASISKRVSRNSWLNSGTLTSDAPVTISQTWNNAAVAFTGLRFNAAGTSDANSAAASKLLDLQIGGVSKFSVDKYGITTSFGAFRQTPTGAGINVSANGNRLALLSNNSTVAYLDGVNFVFDASAILAWSSGSASSGTFDTALVRDSASGNTLALRNGTSAQTFNVYGSYGSISDYKRLSISCDQTTGNATITNQAAGYTAGTVSINGVPVGLGKGNVSTSVAVGTQSINVNPSNAPYNTAIGYQALLNTQAGDANGQNTAVGALTLSNGIGSGSFNSAFGALALLSNYGTDNTAVGSNALRENSTGTKNTALGKNAGYKIAGGVSNNFNGANSLFLGVDTKALDVGQTNQIVIGYDATGIGSNSVVLGNDSITKTALKGNVGIGTTAPRTKFHVEDLLTNPFIELSGTTIPNYTGVGFGPQIGSNTTGRIGQGSFANGALFLQGFSANTNVVPAVSVLGHLGSTSPTQPAVAFVSYKHDGATNRTALAATEISSQWSNGSTPLMTLLGGGNVGIGTTSPTSKLHVAETWNNAGTTFCAIKSVITDTNSAAGSDFLELYSGTSTQPLRMDINKTGQINIYGTWTDASNYERLSFSAPTAANAIIGTNRSGGTARGLEFQTDGVTRMSINSTGAVTFDSNVNINSSLRITFINNQTSALSMFVFASDATGASTYALGGSAPLMRFGGTTDSFPAIARDNAGIKFTGGAAGSTAWVKVPPVAVTALPDATVAGVGARAFVNDALAPTFGSAVTGGGSVPVPVYSTGSAWNVG